MFSRGTERQNLFITDIPGQRLWHRPVGRASPPFPDSIPTREPSPAAPCAASRCRELPRGAGDRKTFGKGRGADLHTFGNDLDVQINDGSLEQQAHVPPGEVDCYCLINNFPPQTLSSFISSEIATVNANP